MRVEVFDTPGKRERGLQHRRSIEPGALFVFTDVPGGVQFHSMNVPEPFDIAFVAGDGTVLLQTTMVPEADVVVAPPGTAWAAEAKAGWLRHWGFAPGRRVRV